MFDEGQLLSERTGQIDASGIRRAFQLGAQLENPINLSIGQPHFPVPEEIKAAAIEAIKSDANGYTLTRGHSTLLSSIQSFLTEDIEWDFEDENIDFMVTSGTSGALVLAAWALLDPRR